MRASHGDRGEVDIIGPSEGLVASSILAGRTKNTEKPVDTRVATGFCLSSLGGDEDLGPHRPPSMAGRHFDSGIAEEW